VWRGLPLCQF